MTARLNNWQLAEEQLQASFSVQLLTQIASMLSSHRMLLIWMHTCETFGHCNFLHVKVEVEVQVVTVKVEQFEHLITELLY